jgi:hypothetical protein
MELLFSLRNCIKIFWYIELCILSNYMSLSNAISTRDGYLVTKSPPFFSVSLLSAPPVHVFSLFPFLSSPHTPGSPHYQKESYCHPCITHTHTNCILDLNSLSWNASTFRSFLMPWFQILTPLVHFLILSRNFIYYIHVIILYVSIPCSLKNICQILLPHLQKLLGRWWSGHLHRHPKIKIS